jgi:hypothetical protein
LVISPLLSISLLVNLLLDVGNPKQYFTSQLFLSFFFFFPILRLKFKSYISSHSINSFSWRGFSR